MSDNDNAHAAPQSSSLLSDEMMPEASVAEDGVATPYSSSVTSAPAAAGRQRKLLVHNSEYSTTSEDMQMKSTTDKSTTKRWTWKKPAGKPNRPSSAYNLFFADVRASLEQPLGFTDLATHVAAKWQTIDDDTKASYEAKALQGKEQYQRDIENWRAFGGGSNNGQDHQASAPNEAAPEEDLPEPPSKKLKSTTCSTCPVCLAQRNSSTPFDAPFYIISCSREFAQQLEKANIPGFQATFILDPTPCVEETAENESKDRVVDASSTHRSLVSAPTDGIDYTAVIEEALQASAETVLDNQAISKLMVKLEEQRALAAVRQQQQQQHLEQGSHQSEQDQQQQVEQQDGLQVVMHQQIAIEAAEVAEEAAGHDIAYL